MRRRRQGEGSSSGPLLSSLRKQGPITTGVRNEQSRRPPVNTEGPRRMGPRFRGDDKTPDSTFKQPIVGPSLRANGSRERAPDDRLREAIHSRPGERRDPYAAASRLAQWLTASAPTNDCGYGSPRTRGPIRRGLAFATVADGFRSDKRLWLWVPAFAG